MEIINFIKIILRVTRKYRNILLCKQYCYTIFSQLIQKIIKILYLEMIITLYININNEIRKNIIYN